MGQHFLAKVAWWSLQKRAESCSSLRKTLDIRHQMLHQSKDSSSVWWPTQVLGDSWPAVGSWERGHIQETLFSAFCLIFKFYHLKENFTVHLGQPWTLLGEKVLSKFEAFTFSPFLNIGWIIRNPPPVVIGLTNISWVFALFCVLLVLGLWRDDLLPLSGWARR